MLGTKAGAQVMYDVSADLKTFAQNTGGHGGGTGHGGDRATTSGTTGATGTSGA